MSAASHHEHCRVCGAALETVFADLGLVPLCQSYITREHAFDAETFYPLRATVCLRCFYVGLPEYVSPQQIFGEYAYFSSTSSSWLAHVQGCVEDLLGLLPLGPESQVVEMASNDGYLLRNFVARGIPVLGVEPAANVAKVANESGVPTLPAFFNRATAEALRRDGKSADLLLAYNCLDHVPDLHDVVAGMRLLLKPDGMIQVELPYLGALVEHGEFDTIYHDRCSYFSLLALNHVFERHGLRIFDVARLPTHGGSLRLRACHAANASFETQASVGELLAAEEAAGMKTAAYYQAFTERMRAAKQVLLDELIHLRWQGCSIVGYGVPAKGNVLLNYCGIRADLIDYLVDRSPYKCGKLAPGSRLEIREVEQVRVTRPDYLLILPWNIRDEIVEQMSFIREWGGRFIVPIPRFQTM